MQCVRSRTDASTGRRNPPTPRISPRRVRRAFKTVGDVSTTQLMDRATSQPFLDRKRTPLCSRWARSGRSELRKTHADGGYTSRKLRLGPQLRSQLRRRYLGCPFKSICRERSSPRPPQQPDTVRCSTPCNATANVTADRTQNPKQLSRHWIFWCLVVGIAPVEARLSERYVPQGPRGNDVGTKANEGGSAAKRSLLEREINARIDSSRVSHWSWPHRESSELGDSC